MFLENGVKVLYVFRGKDIFGLLEMITSKTSDSFPGFGHIQLICQKLKTNLNFRLKYFIFIRPAEFVNLLI